jgi:acyl carrier protein
MNSEIFDRIKKFTIEQGAVEEEEVTEDASLEKDLGIYGDDAIEFIIAYGKEFSVDVSKFMAADYFSPEGDLILPAIIRFFTGKKKTEKKALTLRHLEKAVIAGRLDEEVINSYDPAGQHDSTLP